MAKLKEWDNKFGLFELNGRPIVTTRKIAEIFEREHKHVLESVRKITEPKNGLSEKFAKLNFMLSEYKDSTGRKLPEYYLTRDGFVMLVMGFTGKKAMEFKEAYINKFNEMEKYISALNLAKNEFPELTQAILEVHEVPKSYHFSKEMDMINKIVLGMTAKKFKEENALGDVSSIRPYLTAEQLHLIGMLQKTDIGLVLTEPDYQKRKRTLEWYCEKIKQKLVAA
jgi:Rha family phage regulatory protein